MAAPITKRAKMELDGNIVDSKDIHRCFPIISLPDQLRNKLKHILHLLIENSLPGDDTFLEKLVTMFNDLASSLGPDATQQHEGASLITLLDFGSILEKAVSATDLPPEALSFFLRLVGCMAAQCSGHQNPDLARELFHKATEEEWWQNASVRCAWLEALLGFMKISGGWEWISGKDFSRQVQDCLQDESLFVSQMATKVNMNLILSMLEEGPLGSPPPNDSQKCESASQGSPADTTNLDECLQPVLQPIKELADSKGQESWNEAALTVCLDVLGKLCAHETAAKYLNENYQLLQTLITILTSVGSRHACKCVVSVLTPLVQSRVLMDEDLAKLQSLPLELVIEDRMETALDVVKLLLSCKESGSDTNQMMEVLQLPMLIREPKLHSVCNNKLILDQLLVPGSKKKTSVTNKCLLHSFAVLREIAIHLKQEERVAVLVICEEYLKLHSGESTPSVQRLVQGCLETCSALFVQEAEAPTPEKTSVCKRLVAHCTSYAFSSDTSYVITSKSLKVLLLALEVLAKTCSALGDSGEQLQQDTLPELAEAAKRRLCDLKWEVKDSMLEFLGHVSILAGECPWLQTWFLRHKLGQQIWLCVQDGESYVRASALSALGRLTSNTTRELWDQLLQLVPEDEIFNKVCDLVSEDTEAFARRAGMQLLLSWQQMNLLEGRSEDIMKVMTLGIHDLDWEVKLIVLDYWAAFVTDKLNNGNIPSYATSLGPQESTTNNTQGLGTICQCGGAQLLLNATADCDRVVQRKALQILKHIQSTLSEATIDSGAQDTANGDQGNLVLTVESFVSKLSTLDFRTLLLEAEKSTDHHASNPETLLDDIIASMVQPNPPVQGEGNMDHGMAVDCY